MFGEPIHMEYKGTKDGLFKTFSGGIASIFLNVFLLWLFVTYFIQMASFSNNSTFFNETTVNFEELGKIQPMKFGNIPFYRFKFKGKMMKRRDLKFLMDHVEINWYQKTRLFDDLIFE